MLTNITIQCSGAKCGHAAKASLQEEHVDQWIEGRKAEHAKCGGLRKKQVLTVTVDGEVRP